MSALREVITVARNAKAGKILDDMADNAERELSDTVTLVQEARDALNAKPGVRMLTMRLNDWLRLHAPTGKEGDR